MSVSVNEVFLDSQYAEILQSDGVVKIPFLNNEELDKIRGLYARMHHDKMPTNTMHGIHMTIWHPDEEYKTVIRDGIRDTIEPAFKRNFTDYRTLTHQFIIKSTGEDTTFHIHQDWAIVNEVKDFSLNIWIPLQDVSEVNGAMWIVKGSHRLNYPVRGAGVLYPDYSECFDDLKPYMTSFPMKAGEALIFYHCTLHGSPSNKGEELRKVIQVSLVHENTPLQIYFQKDSNSPLEIHHPDDYFTFRYRNIHEESSKRAPTQKPDKLIYDFSKQYIDKSYVLNIIRLYNVAFDS